MPTAAQIDAARTPKGAWTKATLAGWGVSWPPPKGWRQRLIAQAADTLPSPGQWRITELRPSQCRFACTPHDVARDEHRFCGEPREKGSTTPYCKAHRAIVYRMGSVEGEGSEAEGIAA